MLIAKGISIDPDVCNGRPVVAGTRIAVQSVLGYLSAGDSPEELVEALPPLTLDSIRDCLAFAAGLAGDMEVARTGTDG